MKELIDDKFCARCGYLNCMCDLPDEERTCYDCGTDYTLKQRFTNLEKELAEFKKKPVAIREEGLLKAWLFVRNADQIQGQLRLIETFAYGKPWACPEVLTAEDLEMLTQLRLRLSNRAQPHCKLLEDAFGFELDDAARRVHDKQQSEYDDN